MKHKIAVYGSLKKGFYNYRDSMGEPIAHGTIKGAMYLCGGYPHLYRPEVSQEDLVREHPVEVYEIDESVYNPIERMELGAGYQVYPTKIGEHDVVVFYSRDNHTYKANWIEGYTHEVLDKRYGST